MSENATSLQQLEQQSARMAERFHAVYEQFLTALGVALEQQLIQACFQICTQMQPDHFVALDETAQQELLRVLRALAQDSRAQCDFEPLLELARQSAREESREEAQASETEVQAESELAETPGAADGEGDRPVAPPADADDSDTHPDADPEDLSVEMPEPDLTFLMPTPPAHPAAIHAWRQALDRAVETLLKQVSRQTNVVLDQARVLRNPLPLAVLQAAMLSGQGETAQAPANILRLVLHAGTEEEEGEAESVQVIAVQLRLGDLLLASPSLTEAHAQVRSLHKPLRQLGHIVRQAERRRSVQQAELQWRLAWPGA